MDLLVFSGVMALGQMIPGPDWILVTRNSLAGGKVAGILTSLGIVCGLAIHSSLALFGLTRSLIGSGSLAFYLDFLFAGYLLWLSWGILRPHSSTDPASQVEGMVEKPFVKGFFRNLLNAKVLVFFAAIFTAFLKNDTSAVWLFSLWLITVVQGGFLWAVWVNVLQIPGVVKGWRRWERRMEFCFATTLAAIAVYLLAT